MNRFLSTALPSLLLLALACGDDSAPMEDVDAATADDAGPIGSQDAAPTGDAGEPAADAGPPDLGVPDDFRIGPLELEAIPEGKVPVAVAHGHGRIVTSCDGLQTIAMDDTFSPDANDHHEHAYKGGAFGNGVFVFSTGHGAPGHVFRSTDGLSWEQLPGDAFHYADGSTGLLGGGTRGVFFDGEQFVLIRGRAPRMTSEDGLEWTEEPDVEPLDRTYFHFRSMSFHPEVGRLFIDGTNASKDVHWLIGSDDSALSFAEIEGGFLDECNAWMTYAHGGLVAPGGAAGMCVSFDGGDTWRVDPTPDEFGTYLPTDEGLLGFRGYRRVLHRFDGETWTEETIDGSFRFAKGGHAPWGGYWLASRRAPEFWVSTDGTAFEPMEPIGSGNAIRAMLFGYADPSDTCPLLEE